MCSFIVIIKTSNITGVVPFRGAANCECFGMGASVTESQTILEISDYFYAYWKTYLRVFSSKFCKNQIFS